MLHKIPVYLRTLRRQWALTQGELARLLGLKSSQYISRIENGKRKPGLGVLLGSEILFDKRVKEVFPKLYAEVESRVTRHLCVLRDSLRGDNSAAARKKRELIDDELCDELTSYSNQKEV